MNTLTAYQNMQQATRLNYDRMRPDEIYNTLCQYINDSDILFWEHLKRFYNQKMNLHILDDDELKQSILHTASRNLDPLEHNADINNYHFWTVMGHKTLSNVLNDELKYYRYEKAKRVQLTPEENEQIHNLKDNLQNGNISLRQYVNRIKFLRNEGNITAEDCQQKIFEGYKIDYDVKYHGAIYQEYMKDLADYNLQRHQISNQRNTTKNNIKVCQKQLRTIGTCKNIFNRVIESNWANKDVRRMGQKLQEIQNKVTECTSENEIDFLNKLIETLQACETGNGALLENLYNNINIKCQTLQNTLKDQKAEFERLRKPKNPLGDSPFGREMTRYQIIFLGIVLNCTVDEVEKFLLQKMRHQRGFNLKSPMDHICFYALLQENKYQAWQTLSNEFANSNIDLQQTSSFSERTSLVRNRVMQELEDLHPDEDNNQALNLVISNMYISDEVIEKNNWERHVTGQQILQYSIDQLRYHLFPLQTRSISTDEEMKYLINRLTLNLEHTTDEINQIDNLQRQQVLLVQYQDEILDPNSPLPEHTKQQALQFVQKELRYNVRKLMDLHVSVDIDDDVDFDEVADIYYMLYEKNSEDQDGQLVDTGLFGETIFTPDYIQALTTGTKEITRQDVIFISFAVNATDFRFLARNKNDRLIQFEDFTNAVLRNCNMYELYYPNPFEAFLAICICNDDPIGFYRAVIESNRNNM